MTGSLALGAALPASAALQKALRRLTSPPKRRLRESRLRPEFCGGKFPTASDTEGKIARAYDLQIRGTSVGAKDTRGQDINHASAERTTFIVTPDGKIAATVGGLNPVDNVKKSLEIVQKLKKS